MLNVWCIFKNVLYQKFKSEGRPDFVGQINVLLFGCFLICDLLPEIKFLEKLFVFMFKPSSWKADALHLSLLVCAESFRLSWKKLAAVSSAYFDSTSNSHWSMPSVTASSSRPSNRDLSPDWQ